MPDFTGDSGANTLNGTNLADTILGLDGNDVLSGNGGGDNLQGGNGTDSLFGGAGNDRLFGGGGSDILDGGAGSDTINGGGGIDTASYAGESSGVTVDLYGGTASTSTGTDTLISIENVRGSEQDDTIFGGDVPNVLWGLGGDDVISFVGGGSTLFDGDGNDDLDSVGATIYGGNGDDSLGGDGATLYGGSGNDTVGVEGLAFGGAGDDRLTGGAGTLIGGAGHDVFEHTEYSSGDLVIADFVRGQDVLALRLSGISEGTFFDPPRVWSYDSNGDGRLTDADASVSVSRGDLTIDLAAASGGGDQSTIIVRGVQELVLGTDVTFVGADPGFDTVGVARFGSAAGDTIIGTPLGDVLLGFVGGDRLIGGDGSDDLEGGNGDDRLAGGGGDDLLVGGSGHNTLDGGQGFDLVDYRAVSGAVVIDLANGSAHPSVGTAFDDRLIAVEGAAGSSLDDSIAGGDGDNTLHGEAGSDSIDGGAGTDRLSGGDGSDLLAGGSADDDIDGGNGDDVVFGGTGDDFIGGGDGNDRLFGDSEADNIFGGAGNDTLYGGAGDDTVGAGFGNDTLSGGPGSDTFFYGHSGFGSDSDFGNGIFVDFIRGIDNLSLSTSLLSGPDLFTFLDSNGNHHLDDADAFVVVASVTEAGRTRTSTVIEMGLAGGATPGSPGADDSVVIFGVTGITSSDFASDF